MRGIDSTVFSVMVGAACRAHPEPVGFPSEQQKWKTEQETGDSKPVKAQPPGFTRFLFPVSRFRFLIVLDADDDSPPIMAR
jgi:hypothetical protein